MGSRDVSQCRAAMRALIVFLCLSWGNSEQLGSLLGGATSGFAGSLPAELASLAGLPGELDSAGILSGLDSGDVLSAIGSQSDLSGLGMDDILSEFGAGSRLSGFGTAESMLPGISTGNVLSGIGADGVLPALGAAVGAQNLLSGKPNTGSVGSILGGAKALTGSTASLGVPLAGSKLGLGGIYAGATAGKVLKAAAIPVKKATVKKMASAKVLAPKLALKVKPKVYSLKPIVHVVEKPVPVFHKVPIPKKVLVPKFYPVLKPIPVPKIVPVPFKVPVKKIVPKIVKIPKAIPIPKFVPVKKPVPIKIPYPVPKIYKVPVWKPVPYPKFIPIPIPKKVPKFVPVPVKKVIKVPKPFYVPVKVPHITASYMKTPMMVPVPAVKIQSIGYSEFPKAVPTKIKLPGVGRVEQPIVVEQIYEQPVVVEKGQTKEKLKPSIVNIIPSENQHIFQMKDSNKAHVSRVKLPEAIETSF